MKSFLYRKLKRTWAHGYAENMHDFKKVFPELSHLSSEELCDRFIDLNMEFYYEEKMPVNKWVRITLPFALITILIMTILLPLNFVITGQWWYDFGKKNLLLNWFKSLKLA